jgi:hypothetical protein
LRARRHALATGAWPGPGRDLARPGDELKKRRDSVAGVLARRSHKGAAGGSTMEAASSKQLKTVYMINERNGKSFWTKIGIGFVNRDGSINLKVEAWPTTGSIQIRDYEPYDAREGRRGEASAEPAPTALS